MPALVVATLALQLWKTKTPGWESIDTVRIAGVGIGWKPWQVVDVLGKPEYKGGDMAGGGMVAAIFESNVTVLFEYGTVQSIEENKANPLTNILSVDSLPKDIEQLYGKPSNIRTMQSEKLKWIHWEYPNGVTYVFTNGSLSSVDVSKYTWDTFQVPGWGIAVSSLTGSTQSNRTTNAIVSSRIKGVIKNSRNGTVKVVLRATWSYDNGRKVTGVADLYDSEPITVSPNGSAVFEMTGGSIPYSDQGKSVTFDVAVKSVEEL
jgi:hypothetical protein